MHNFDKVYFKSKVVGRLSSQNLQELKSTLLKAKARREELKKKISIIEQKVTDKKSKLRWLNWFPIKLLFKEKISLINQVLLELNSQQKSSEEEYEKCLVAIDISLSERLDTVFGTLDDKFSDLLSTDKIWDITTSQKVDKFVERTTANNFLERKVVSLKRSNNEKILCDFKSFHFENANGGDLHLFPQFIFIEKENDFALVDLLDLEVDFSLVSFIEDEHVPCDTEVVDHTWAKANKNGSRDKRFVDNYQIPVVEYGKLHFKTATGLNEVYMLSDPKPAFDFKCMLDEYKSALANA